MILIFLGPPGSGKGTQAKQLSAKLNIPHIALGDILREAIRNETEIGKVAKGFVEAGKLVPDEITIKITADRIKQADCAKGFILDGFPRSTAQAEAVEKELAGKDFKVLYFGVSLESVIDRNCGRLSCPNCGAVYHVKYSKPKNDNKCDKCGADLYQRKDDTAEIIKNRFTVYEDSTKPLVARYQAKGNIINIDAQGTIEEVFGRLVSALEL